MSNDALVEHIETLREITAKMNESIKKRTQLTNDLAVAKAEVEMYENQKDLVMQQLQIEKKRMDIR